MPEKAVTIQGGEMPCGRAIIVTRHAQTSSHARTGTSMEVVIKMQRVADLRQVIGRLL
jgi:hypothetical protein